MWLLAKSRKTKTYTASQKFRRHGVSMHHLAATPCYSGIWAIGKPAGQPLDAAPPVCAGPRPQRLPMESRKHCQAGCSMNDTGVARDPHKPVNTP
jgi:hypothetical protein